MESNNTLAILSLEEQRVLGALMEKSRATPEYYPLTLNSLQSACNQKSSRRPVVQYDEDTIIATLDILKKKGLIATATGGSSRVIKYRHTLSILYPILPAEITILCLLLLRGPLTVGELNNNAGRLYTFESLQEIQEYIDKLIINEPAMIVQIPRQLGQKEVRYMHLFGGQPDLENSIYQQDNNTNNSQHSTALEERVNQLELELAELKTSFNQLMKELMG